MTHKPIVAQNSKCKQSFDLTCHQCGINFEFRGSKGKARTRRYCSRNCWRLSAVGEGNPHYVGWRLNHNGYLYLSRNGKAVLQHREIMEKHLGRKLRHGEVVHHIDGNRTNNSVENLIVLKSQGQHNNHHATTYRDKSRKQCTQCLQLKDRSKFHLQFKNRPNDNYDDHDTMCKQCRQQRRR